LTATTPTGVEIETPTTERSDLFALSVKCEMGHFASRRHPQPVAAMKLSAVRIPDYLDALTLRQPGGTMAGGMRALHE
jgi:hypothetical protein